MVLSFLHSHNTLICALCVSAFCCTNKFIAQSAAPPCFVASKPGTMLGQALESSIPKEL
jgi:hypothetical protein